MCGYALFLFSLTRATNKINHDTRTIDKDKAIQRKGILGLMRFNPTCTKACKNNTIELEWLLEAVNRQLYVSYRSYVDLKIITRL